MCWQTQVKTENNDPSHTYTEWVTFKDLNMHLCTDISCYLPAEMLMPICNNQMTTDIFQLISLGLVNALVVHRASNINQILVKNHNRKVQSSNLGVCITIKRNPVMLSLDPGLSCKKELLVAHTRITAQNIVTMNRNKKDIQKNNRNEILILQLTCGSWDM